MSLQTVRTQLKSIVDGVKTAQAEISATLDYMPAQITATPLVCIIYDSANEDYATTGQNMLEANFIIRVIIDNTANYSTQNNLMLSIVDDLLDAFRLRTNQTLGGNVYSTLVRSVSSIQSGLTENLSVLFVDIGVTAKGLKTT